MIDISKPLTSVKAKHYYKQEYSAASNNYLSQGQSLEGHASGALVQALGLGETVTPEQFDRLMNGQHPITGEQLIRHKDTVKTQAGDELGHRAGWDVTINASKSVSVTALVGQDHALREAHLRAERTAIEWGSQFIQARTGARTPAETTGKALWISFEHTTARPVNGYSAPQLHGHNILVNLTQDSAGKWRSLQTAELFRIQKGMRAVYHSEMGHYLLSRGFEVERGTNNSVEIKGYSKEYLEAESPRSRQIKEAVEEWEKKTGRIADREVRQRIAHEVRDEKAPLPPGQQVAAWQANAERFQNQPEVVMEAAALRHVASFREERATGKTREAVDHAIASLSEREAVFEHWKLVETALDHNLTTSVARVEAEIARRQQRGELIAVGHVRPDAPLHRFTTPEMIGIEKEVIEQVLAGQNQPHVTAPIREADLARFPDLNADQQRVFREALLSHDRVFGIQGKPGTGKSFPLGSIKQLAEEHGYTVKGLGPTSQATKGLRDAGIDSRTLQMHLVLGPETSNRPTLYFLDESSLASGKQMREFLRTMQPQDRALLVGDTGQHQSVEAGRIFSELQDAGMRVAKLDRILRQKDEGLLKAVEAATQGKIAESLELLKTQGRLHEIPNRAERLNAMARDFATAPDSALLLSPDNRSRHELDAATRAQLRTAGKLAEASFNASVLLPRQDVTGADRQRAASYRPGDTVLYRGGSREKGIAAKSYTQVVSVDTENNLLTVRKQNGVYRTYDPARLHGVSLYQSAERSFSVGDRIQFLQKWDAKGVNTRDRATITRLDRHGNISVRTEDGGKTIRWNLSRNKHIDYAYAMTSHSAQAATVDRALLHIDTGDPRLRAALDQTTFSVSLSRARYDAHIYTDSIENLARTLSRKNENTQALSPEQVSEYRQNIPTPERSQERTLRPELQRERSPSQGQELAI